LIPFGKHQGKRDFMQLSPVATLNVGSCPAGAVKIPMYSVACPETFAAAADQVSVLYTCSGSSSPYTLSLFNAFTKADGAAYSGSYIISGYQFGSATVLTGPAQFSSLTLTCTSATDYCGTVTPYVSGCVTSPSPNSASNGDTIYVFPSADQVDLCNGGGLSCCSAVSASNCPGCAAYGCTTPSYVAVAEYNCGTGGICVNSIQSGTVLCAGVPTLTVCTSDAQCDSGYFCSDVLSVVSGNENVCVSCYSTMKKSEFQGNWTSYFHN